MSERSRRSIFRPEGVVCFGEVVLTQLLQAHNVNVGRWGRGEAKALEHLLKEISQGECHLTEEDGELYRNARVLGLDVYCFVDGRMKILKEVKQVFTDGRMRKRTIPTSLGEKLELGEDPAAGVERALKEELNIECTTAGKTDEEVLQRESQSYPGLKTRLHLYTYAALIDAAYYKPEGYVERQSDKATYFEWLDAE